ncbi:hypothetical protein BpHYR1_030892 [Brachionus plicatilis]|uniref:Uncharacterized protein n=1 Tax=Brachionus plicatilis TaxID=10195 RepID=A0A3M7PG17_BRAPC|nr:hypothetical protein BpHYR1_030892 [Brachionus plicatilis]
MDIEKINNSFLFDFNYAKCDIIGENLSGDFYRNVKLGNRILKREQNFGRLYHSGAHTLSCRVERICFFEMDIMFSFNKYQDCKLEIK